jgi:glutamate racemase
MTSTIGIFDSGFGGLTILKGIVSVLPQYDYVYLGDTARAPYGDRSQETIYEFTRQGVRYLFDQGCELVILACNTASSEALRKIQHEFLVGEYANKRVLGVIIPAIEESVLVTKNKRIGVLATSSTVASHAFLKEIKKKDESIDVFEVAAPLLVPLVEVGEIHTESTKMIIKNYVDEIKSHDVDTVILGCTHYGILEEEIKSCLGNISVINESMIVAHKLKDYLARHSEIENRLTKASGRVFFTTDNEARFDGLGSGFFGGKISSIKVEL